LLQQHNFNQLIGSHSQQQAQHLINQQVARPQYTTTISSQATNNTQSQNSAQPNPTNIVMNNSQVQSASGHPMFIPILQNLNEEVINLNNLLLDHDKSVFFPFKLDSFYISLKMKQSSVK
jgi:hypothetical protein